MVFRKRLSLEIGGTGKLKLYKYVTPLRVYEPVEDFFNVLILDALVVYFRSPGTVGLPIFIPDVELTSYDRLSPC